MQDCLLLGTFTKLLVSVSCSIEVKPSTNASMSNLGGEEVFELAQLICLSLLLLLFLDVKTSTPRVLSEPVLNGFTRCGLLSFDILKYPKRFNNKLTQL